MKINFTKKQYRTLLDMIYLGEFMINGIRDGDETLKEYEELEQFIYSFSHEMGCEELIVFDRKLGMYFASREFEEARIDGFIADYEEAVFWDELASRLAMRDVKKEIDDSTEISREDLFIKMLGKEEIYSQEFYDNGLKNLIIKE